MEIIAEIIKDSVSRGFWYFCGYWIIITVIIGIPGKILIHLINRPLRHWNIQKHGWPPPHCDADGDFKKDDKSEEDDI